MRFFLVGSTSPGEPATVPSRASAVRVMNDGARKPEATSKAPRPMSERRVDAMGVPQAELVSGHGQGQVDQAARLHVEGGAVVERQLAGRRSGSRPAPGAPRASRRRRPASRGSSRPTSARRRCGAPGSARRTSAKYGLVGSRPPASRLPQLKRSNNVVALIQAAPPFQPLTSGGLSRSWPIRRSDLRRVGPDVLHVQRLERADHQIDRRLDLAVERLRRQELGAGEACRAAPRGCRSCC